MPLSQDLSQQHPQVARWFERRQQELQPAATTSTPTGLTVDWVKPESQVSGQIATPPPSEKSHAPVDPKYPTRAASLDLPEPGPEGLVPVLRPDLSKLTATLNQMNGNGSMDQLLLKRGGLGVNRHKPNGQPVDPNPAGYFHATSAETVTCYDCEAWYNVWDPRVDIPSSPGDDHSITQTWIQNYQKPKAQSVEAGLTVDKTLNGDTFNHLFSYFTTNGYTADGDNIGGYNRLHKGWVQVHASIFPGIRINGSSAQGATSQLEVGIKFQLYNGNWWLGFNNNESGPWIWLGYYPASLFAGGLGNVGQWVSFGGEVYSALANPCSTKDDMGSGRLAAAGFSHACFQRNLKYQSTTAGAMTNFNGAKEVDGAASNCPANEYSINTFMNSGGSWASYQYFGGQSA